MIFKIKITFVHKALMLVDWAMSMLQELITTQLRKIKEASNLTSHVLPMAVQLKEIKKVCIVKKVPTN